jgi:hypothetical protein
MDAPASVGRRTTISGVALVERPAGALLLGLAAPTALAAAALATALAPSYLSPDSVHYLDVAESLRRGLGPVSFLLHLASPGVPSATGLWPDGYPAALSILERLGLDAARAPAVLNAAALVVLALSLRALARLAALPGWLTITAVAAAVAHPALRHVLAHAWSEPLFVALTTATLALLAHGLARGRPAALLAAGAAAGLAFTVRYAGLFLVGYALAAALGWGLWAGWPVRRHLGAAARLLVGPLLAAPLALGANLRGYGHAFGLPRLPAPDLGLALLDRGRELLAALDVLPACWGTALLLVALLLAGRTAGPREVPPRPEPAPRLAVAALLVGWLPWYVGALLLSVARLVTDPIDQRLLSPAIPALVLAAFLLAAPRLRRLAGRPGWLLAGAALGLALVGHVDAAVQRRRDPPVLQASPELLAWARARAAPTTLVVASRGWELRSGAGAVVLEDGYPDMAPLEPGAVLAFLEGPGRAFERAALVFDPAGSLPPSRLPSLLAEAARRGWRLETREELPGATGVTLARGP